MGDERETMVCGECGCISFSIGRYELVPVEHFKVKCNNCGNESELDELFSIQEWNTMCWECDDE